MNNIVLNMKLRYLIFLFPVFLFSCKEDNWQDWKLQNEMWLESNLSKPGVQVTEDSLQYIIIYNGIPTDAKPQAGSTIYCDYTLQLINGYQVDAGHNAAFSLSNLIPGFVEGVKKIHNQGDIILFIPWTLGYGKDGNGTEGTSGFIPPYSTLIYEIHLSGVAN